MNKKLAALFLSSVMAAGIVGCGESAAPAQTSSSNTETASGTETEAGSEGGYSTDSITINIWDSNQQAGLQTIADEWSAKSGVKVNIEVIDWDNYWTLLEAGASGGEMPDVFWMHSNTAQMYMENDILLDLTDYIAADASVNQDNFYEGVWNLYSSGGKQYALPKDHDTIALLYNKAIFDKYGVDYPTDDWTWDDMYEAAKAITEGSNGDVYGMAMNTSNNQDGWYNLVYDYGAKVITDDHKGTTIGSAEGKAGMEMVRKLLTVGAPQSVVAETGTDSLFMSGKAAMITQGSWMINAFYTAENHADYAWAMLPYADTNANGACDAGERYSAYNGLGWAANANVADPKACYDLISYFCSEEGQKKQAELGVTMGGLKGVSEDFAGAFEGMDVSAFVRAEEEGDLFFRPYTRKTTVWEDALQQQGGFLDAWQNPSDAALMETACDNAQKIIEDAIAAE
ncbi:sugar ABC transporter substrate-binding protein [Butyrivibrio sp.]|uniref:ABC transporter substrate-binding protein n=1 Tax=Butyrivibrio sp. TaxID=28121 RepID=UPI0025C0A81A|nr:sugar ABC transporter substrate-binding protein [Butyrivibrio sp.]MBQ9303827.1 sugar ABC transporter substrate-binding protein [Butyrivibrio sp.]MBR1856642.1 sugar ABC transporter substrate-binding protein [Oribacterium sp.]